MQFTHLKTLIVQEHPPVGHETNHDTKSPKGENPLCGLGAGGGNGTGEVGVVNA